MSVSQSHWMHSANIDKWRRCRDVISGQDAVYAGGEKYLPRLTGQTDAEYKSMQQRGAFFPATGRTLEGMLGMMFRRDPDITLPPRVMEYAANINLCGGSIQSFSNDLAVELLTTGKVGIFVDYNAVDDDGEQITAYMAEQMGLRPYMRMYRAEDIINWSYDGGRLSQVVLVESKHKRESEFVSKSITQYRVVDIDAGKMRVRVFEIDKRGNDVLVEGPFYPKMNDSTLTEIPFIMIDLPAPPLLGMANVNLSHFRSSVDYEHGCHFTGLPTPVISGYQLQDGTDKLYIGGTAAWVFPNPDASAKYLEFSGQGLSSLKENIDRKERQMIVLGSRILSSDNPQAEAAATAEIHRAGENSVLAKISCALSAGMKSALTIFAEWIGAQGDIAFEVNKDFVPGRMSPQELNALVTAWQAGAISAQTLFDNLKSGEIITADTSFDDEQGRIMSSGP